jgi:YesN/AraC family two-component response regulator
MKPRILIVDDHEIVREGIRTLLAKTRTDWEVCGEAANANDALEAVKRLKPDVVILDITMPGMSGLEAAQRMKKLDVTSRVLIFTMHESAGLGAEVHSRGVRP